MRVLGRVCRLHHVLGQPAPLVVPVTVKASRRPYQQVVAIAFEHPHECAAFRQWDITQSVAGNDVKARIAADEDTANTVDDHMVIAVSSSTCEAGGVHAVGIEPEDAGAARDPDRTIRSLRDTGDLAEAAADR